MIIIVILTYKVKLPALSGVMTKGLKQYKSPIGNHDRPLDQPTKQPKDQPTDQQTAIRVIGKLYFY